MSRNLDPTLAASLSDGVIYPIIMAMLTFRTSTQYVWSGIGSFIWNGNTYLGVGSLGKIGVVTEGTEIRADGTTLELSGIDKTLQGECLTDVQTGLPAKIWFGNILNGRFVGIPYLLFSGTVDVPTFNIDAETITIQLALENKMIDLSRPRMQRYTSADQHLKFPTDTGFNWVEQLNDLALRWGS